MIYLVMEAWKSRLLGQRPLSQTVYTDFRPGQPALFLRRQVTIHLILYSRVL
jgi:hypothetical protein